MPGMMKRSMFKSGGKSKKFPDMSGDGKVTKKDVLIARGVIKKPKKGAKNGKAMSKGKSSSKKKV